MGLPDSRKRFKIGLAVRTQYRRVRDRHPSSHLSTTYRPICVAWAKNISFLFLPRDVVSGVPVEHRIAQSSWLQLHHSTSIRRPFDVELKSNLNCIQRITNFVSLMCYVNNGLARPTCYLEFSPLIYNPDLRLAVVTAIVAGPVGLQLWHTAVAHGGLQP